MANKASAVKHLRQTEKRTEYNSNIKGNVKYLIKQTKKAATSGADTKDLEQKTVKAIDRATARKVYKKTTAARMKTRLIKFIRSVAK